MIAIIDYGIGNLHSVEKAFLHVGAEARLTNDPSVVRDADGVVVPGVGAFGSCALGLHGSGLQPLVLDAIDAGKPRLGICVGMQLLFEEARKWADTPVWDCCPAGVLRFPDGQWMRPDSASRCRRSAGTSCGTTAAIRCLPVCHRVALPTSCTRTIAGPATRRTSWQA